MVDKNYKQFYYEDLSVKKIWGVAALRILITQLVQVI